MCRDSAEMGIVVHERPEGETIHQPRATPWEQVFPKSISQGVDLGFRVAAPFGAQKSLRRTLG
jgi:hypothetical protein